MQVKKFQLKLNKRPQLLKRRNLSPRKYQLKRCLQVKLKRTVSLNLLQQLRMKK